MNQRQKIIGFILLLITILLSIVLWEKTFEPTGLSKEAEEALEKMEFKNVDEARNAFFEKTHSETGVGGYTLPIDDGEKDKVFSIISEAELPNGDSSIYSIAYAIKNSKTNHYQLKIVERNIKPAHNMKPVLKSYKINGHTAEYYYGPAKEMPFSQNSSGVTNLKYGNEIRFSNKEKAKKNEKIKQLNVELSKDFAKTFNNEDSIIVEQKIDSFSNGERLLMASYKENGKNFIALALGNVNHKMDKNLKVINNRIEVKKGMETYRETYEQEDTKYLFAVDDNEFFQNNLLTAHSFGKDRGIVSLEIN